MTTAIELDRHVFQRLPQLTPFWMAHERKWLVMWCHEDGCEVERFDTQEQARAFIAEAKGANGHD